MPIWFETDEEVQAAVDDLARLSPSVRRILSAAIEHQGKRVSRVSPGARTLEGLGFLFIRDESLFDGSARLDPSLWGEEALDAFELAQQQKPAKRRPRGSQATVEPKQCVGLSPRSPESE